MRAAQLQPLPLRKEESSMSAHMSLRTAYTLVFRNQTHWIGAPGVSNYAESQPRILCDYNQNPKRVNRLVRDSGGAWTDARRSLPCLHSTPATFTPCVDGRQYPRFEEINAQVTNRSQCMALAGLRPVNPVQLSVRTNRDVPDIEKTPTTINKPTKIQEHTTIVIPTGVPINPI